MYFEQPKNKNDYIWRFEKNPIVDLKANDFWHCCNSAVIEIDGMYKGIFRIENPSGTPILVSARSKDGIHFEFGDPIDLRNQDGTPFIYDYAYDPRLVKIGNEILTIFCADANGPSIYIAKVEDDFKKYTVYPCGFLPFNRNGVLFPEKINGKYMMLNRPSDNTNTPFGHIYLSESDDLIHWGNHKLVMKNFDPEAKNFWERIKIGAGPAPIKTKEGWLLIYHGVQGTCNGWTYSFSVALLDLKDPSKVLYKAKRYLMTPDTVYEKTGFTANVIFPTTALHNEKGEITIYYGCSDENMGIAFTTVDKLLEFVKKYN